MELAGALLKPLRNFLQRDMIYILGGFSVLVSALVAFDSAEGVFKQNSLGAWLIIIGASYVIGFTAQELFCLVGFTTTSALFKPRPIDQFFYERYMREKWKDPKNFDQYAVSVKISQAPLTDQTMNDLERIVCLLLLTATLGSCATLSGLIIGLSTLKNECCQMLWIAAPIFLFGLILILRNRVIAAQYRWHVHTLYLKILEDERKASRTSKK
jgi:hypothetical protein